MAYDVYQRPGEPGLERRRYLRRSLLFVAVGMAIAALPLVAFPGGEVQLIGSVIPVALMTALYRAAHGKSERGFRWLHVPAADDAPPSPVTSSAATSRASQTRSSRNVSLRREPRLLDSPGRAG
jgi:hypothetical protein